MTVQIVSPKIKALTLGKSGEIREDCPECDGSKSLGINADTGVFSCFKCEIAGNFKFQKNKKKQYSTEETARWMWNNSQPVNGHKYLKEKNIGAYGVRQFRDDLVVPVRNIAGELVTLQKIFPEKRRIGDSETNKIFLKNTHGKPILPGCFHKIDGNGANCLCEGYATGATAHEATGGNVYIAFQAHNLESAFKKISSEHGNAVTVCADNDHRNDFNPGLQKAMAVALNHDAKICWPSGITGSDFNDLMLEQGTDAVKNVIGHAKTFEELIADNKNIIYKKWMLKALATLKDDAPEKYAQKRSFLKSQKIKIGEFDSLINMNTEREDGKQGTKIKPHLKIRPGFLSDEVEFCQDVIRKNGDIYERGGKLFFVGSVKDRPGKPKREVKRDKKTLLLTEINLNWLKLYLNKNITFLKYDEKLGKTKYINCKKELAESILANVGDWDFPYISGLLECPTITTEGRIIKDVGYDAETGLLLTNDLGGIDFYDVEKAKEIVHNIILEFSKKSSLTN